MRLLFVLLLATVFSTGRAASDLPPLVDASWVLAQPSSADLVWLDIQPRPYYQQVHLAGAVSAPFDGWRGISAAGVKGMLPAIDKLETKLGGLGIAPSDRLVIVTTGLGAGDMAAAARVFWTLKVLGHAQVAILDGGLQAVADDPRGLARLTREPAGRAVTRYKAKPDLSLLADSAATDAALKRGDVMVDARSAAEYLGVHVSGEGERPGSLPGARNLPFDWLTENGSGKMLPSARVRALLQAVDIDPAAPQVHYCHTGNRAALTWFAAWAMLGNKQARLYDASMLEWAMRPDLPLEQQVQF